MKASEEAAFEVWKVTIDVQKHFNELSLRVRSIAVTVLGALLAAAGYALKEHQAVDFLGYQVSLTGMVLLAALVCWAAFYVMDRLWYHRLLKASVRHGRKVERSLERAIPDIGLSGTIDDASPIWGLRAGHRLTIFYSFFAAVLFLASGVSLGVGKTFYSVGIGLLLIVLVIEFWPGRPTIETPDEAEDNVQSLPEHPGR